MTATLFLTACGMFDTHPYDVNLSGERDVNAHNIAKIEQNLKGKTTIRFAVMGDSQRWYDETEIFVDSINARGDIDFVIHGGDISDFGVTEEFLWQRDILNKMKVPYVVIIGNHDCQGTGDDAYEGIFGETNFSFIAGDVKFVCLNTNALEYDYTKPVPDLNFLENEVTSRQGEFDKTVISMHARPLCDQFNNNVAKVFEYYIKMFPGLQFCTVAHDHKITVEQYFNDGVMYYGSDCMKNRNYLLFTITPKGYEREVVYF